MAIGGLLNQSIVVANPTGPDVHNKQGYATPVTYKGRFEQTYKIIPSTTQEQMAINGIVFLPATADIQENAKVTYNGGLYRTIVVSPIVDGQGRVHHIECMVQNWNT